MLTLILAKFYPLTLRLAGTIFKPPMTKFRNQRDYACRSPSRPSTRWRHQVCTGPTFWDRQLQTDSACTAHLRRWHLAARWSAPRPAFSCGAHYRLQALHYLAEECNCHLPRRDPLLAGPWIARTHIEVATACIEITLPVTESIRDP